MSATARTPYLEYDDANHVYYLDGEEVVSITQVLTEVGAINKDYFTEESARRGTLVHSYAEWHDAGLQLESVTGYSEQEHEVAARYAAQWVKLREQVHFDIMPGGIEQKVFDPIHRYAGRLDRHIKLRAPCIDAALIEIKTNQSGYVPKWAGLQLAAQGHALAPNELFRRFVFVLTPERWVPHEFPIEEYVQDRDTFLSMVNAVRWLRANA